MELIDVALVATVSLWQSWEVVEPCGDGMDHVHHRWAGHFTNRINPPIGQNKVSLRQQEKRNANQQTGINVKTNRT